MRDFTFNSLLFEPDEAAVEQLLDGGVARLPSVVAGRVKVGARAWGGGAGRARGRAYGRPARIAVRPAVLVEHQRCSWSGDGSSGDRREGLALLGDVVRPRNRPMFEVWPHNRLSRCWPVNAALPASPLPCNTHPCCGAALLGCSHSPSTSHLPTCAPRCCSHAAVPTRPPPHPPTLPSPPVPTCSPPHHHPTLSSPAPHPSTPPSPNHQDFVGGVDDLRNKTLRVLEPGTQHGFLTHSLQVHLHRICVCVCMRMCVRARASVCAYARACVCACMRYWPLCKAHEAAAARCVLRSATLPHDLPGAAHTCVAGPAHRPGARPPCAPARCPRPGPASPCLCLAVAMYLVSRPIRTAVHV